MVWVYPSPVQAAASFDAMISDPVGSFFAPSTTSLVWCQSPTLGGAVVWGQPGRDEVERLLTLFDVYQSSKLASCFAVILDGRGIEAIDPDGLAVLLQWLDVRRVDLMARVQIQFGVVTPNSILGVTLSGILPIVGKTHEFRVVADPLVAFRELSPEGESLCAEVERAVAHARGVPDELRRLRDHLRSHPLEATLEAAASALGVAERSLQRHLQEASTTFRAEVRSARYLRARELLVGGNDKVATVARRVGLSEGALTQLVREKSGHTPAELRRLDRA